MISNAHRFHGRASLRFVYQRGQTVRGPLVSLRYVRNNRQDAYRAAVVVSRKTSKSAVVRNRIRRRIYEIIRTNAAQFTQPYDLVFSVYSEEPATMSPVTLRKLVLGHLRQAGVLPAKIAPETDRDIVKGKET